MKRILSWRKVAVLALIGAMPSVASATTIRPSAPARQAAICRYFAYLSTPIGLVLPSVVEPDRPGPNGNEVTNVARVFFSSRVDQLPASRFAGWLTTSFDGRYAFTPAGVASQLGASPMSLTVRPDDEHRLPLGTWLRTLATAHSVFDPSLKPLLSGERVSTTLEPCFTSAWDGSPNQ